MSRRAAANLVLAVIAVAGAIVGAILLSKTTIPGDLKTPKIDVAREFAGTDLGDAAAFERLLRWTFIGSQVTLVVVLALYAKHGARYVRDSAAGPIGTGFLLGMLGLAFVWIAQLPFHVVDYWWAHKHDVVEVGWFDFLFGDWLALSAQFLFVCFALLLAMGFARRLARTWWLPAAAAFVALTLLFAYISPLLASGLRDPKGPQLRAEAAEIARKEGVPSIPLKVEEVHEITDAPNAYAFGLGSTRKVVLWDTIVGFPRPQVRVVIAHEYGHQAHHHIIKSVGWTALVLIPTALLVSLLTRRRGGMARPEAVPVALLVFIVLTIVATPLESAASRRFEREADWSALRTTRDPAAMKGLFQRFTSEALADPDPPGWYHALFDDHPSGAERVAMAKAWAAREGVPVP